MDSAIEITLWFIFSFAVALLLLNFFFGIDYDNFSEFVSSIITTSDESKEVTIQSELNKKEFILETINVWEKCGFGQIHYNKSLRYKDSQSLNKNQFFDFIKDNNMCNVISSNSNNCGDSEDIDFSSTISNDSFVRIICNPSSEQINIVN